MRRFCFLLGFALLISGCEVVEPLVQDFNIISVPEEAALGEKLAAQIATEMPVVNDPVALQQVRSVGQQLVAVLPHKDFQYQFYVVKDNTPNAFTIPGGKIYVHTGLLKFAQDESELAGVLAHELGHAYARHPAKGMSRQLGVEYLSGILFKGDQAKLKSMAVQIAQAGVLTRYSREDERQADELGFSFLRRTNYRPDGLRRFLMRLLTLEKGSGTSLSFLSTHPPTPERIARLEALERGEIPVGAQSQLIGSPQVSVPQTSIPTQNVAPYRAYSSRRYHYSRN